MLRIAVCDDEKEILDKIEEMLYVIEEGFEEKYQIKRFTDGKALLESLAGGEKYDIVFLDISMPEVSGVRIGQYIRQDLQDNYTQIVFVSSNERYAMELFQVQPMDFLIKPVELAQLQHIMQLLNKMLSDSRQVFVYEYNGNSYRELIGNIMYFESDRRKLYIHTINGKMAYYNKLESVYKEVEKYGFRFIHQSYLVNIYKIKAFGKDHIIMENGEKLPISRSRRDEVRHLCNTLC